MSLVAHYKLDNNAIDATGRNSAGTIVSATYSSSGRIGGCYYWDGTVTPYIQLPNSVFQNMQDFSISIWYNCVAFNDRYLFSIENSDSANHVLIGINSGNIKVFIKNTSYTPAATNSTGVWDLATISRKGNTLSIYKNNTLLGSTTSLSSDMLSATGAIVLGQEQDGVLTGFSAAQAWYGNIDEVRVYNHALSLKEVSELYKCKILHYKFDKFEEYTENLIGSGYRIDATSWNKVNHTASGTKTFIDGTEVVNYLVTDEGYAYTDSATGLTNGVTTTASLYVYCNADYTFRLRWNATTGGGADFPVKAQVWTRLPIIKVYDSAISVPQRFLMGYRNTDGAPDPPANFEVAYAYAQIENKDHATPFVDGIRNDVITDSSGYENDGYLAANLGPTWTSSGPIGIGYASFSGAQYFTSPVEYINATEWTYSCWAYKTAYVQYQSLFSDYVSASNKNIICGYEASENSMRFYCGSGLTAITATVSSIFVADEWAHWVFTYKASTYIRIYKNGQMVAENTVSVPASIAAVHNVRYIGRYSSYYFNGYIGDARIYLSAISEADITELYKTRASLSSTGSLITQEIKENNNYDEYIKANNLVTNGDQRLLSDYNFSSYTYNADKYLTLTGTSSTTFSDDYIKIDPFHTYKGEVEIRLGDTAQHFYAGIVCCDRNKATILAQYVNHYANTETTLSTDLINGDTVVNLTSSANWATTPASSMYVGVWDSSQGYPPYTFTRKSVAYSSVGTNQVTLSAPWAGGTFLAGTQCANYYTGASYLYIFASNQTTQTTWTKYNGSNYQISGWGINTTSTDGFFRYGTEYVRMLFLMNRDSSATTHMRNSKFYDITDDHAVHYILDNSNLTTSGTFECDEVVEFPSRDLLAYYTFNNGLLIDSSGNNQTLTNTNGVTITTGKKGNGALFVSASAQRLQIDSTFFIRSSFSISLWVKSAGLGSGMTYGGLCNITYGLRVRINGTGNLNFVTYLNSADILTSTGVNFFDNTWHHIACTYSILGLKTIYIDGEYNISATNFHRWTSTNNLYLGWDPNNSIYYLDGSLDEVAIYSRDITATEVKALYNLGNPPNMSIGEDTNLYTPYIIEG